MKRFLSGIQMWLCGVIVLAAVGSVYAGNPGLDARWQVLKSGSDSVSYPEGTYIRLRLQIKCVGQGIHKLNSADFYFDYDTNTIKFNKKAIAGTDYIWGADFDPAKVPMYKGSQVVDFGTDPFSNNGLNIMDINIINMEGTIPGAPLDSGAWINVVDVVLHIKEKGHETKLVWEMNKSGPVLIDTFDSFETIPANYNQGDYWPNPVTIKLN